MCHTSEYGCEHHGHHGHHGPGRAGHHHRGCCRALGYLPRHFPTKEEAITQLEEYLKQLQAEAKGVEEHIAELRKGEA